MEDLARTNKGNEENVNPVKDSEERSDKLRVPQKQRGIPPVTLEVEGRKFTTTPVFDVFWRYASERQAIEDKRRAGEPQP